MGEGLARELELFRKALELPTVGMAQVGELELLRSLVGRYPEQARAYLAEVRGSGERARAPRRGARGR